MQGHLSKSSSEFQDSDGRALNQVQGPSECGALCDCTGHMPMKLVLLVTISQVNRIFSSQLKSPNRKTVGIFPQNILFNPVKG